MLTFIHAHTHAHMYTHTQILFWFILLKILDYKSLQHSEIDWYIQDDTGNISGAYDESEKRDSVGETKLNTIQWSEINNPFLPNWMSC